MRYLTSPVQKVSVGRENFGITIICFLLPCSVGIIIHIARDRILSYMNAWSDIYGSSPLVVSCYHEEKREHFLLVQCSIVN